MVTTVRMPRLHMAITKAPSTPCLVMQGLQTTLTCLHVQVTLTMPYTQAVLLMPCRQVTPTTPGLLVKY